MLAEHGSIEIRASLVDRANREVLGGRAAAEPSDLRKDIPYPMRPLGAAADFGERRERLCLDEAVERVRPGYQTNVPRAG